MGKKKRTPPNTMLRLAIKMETEKQAEIENKNQPQFIPMTIVKTNEGMMKIAAKETNIEKGSTNTKWEFKLNEKAERFTGLLQHFGQHTGEGAVLSHDNDISTPNTQIIGRPIVNLEKEKTDLEEIKRRKEKEERNPQTEPNTTCLYQGHEITSNQILDRNLTGTPRYIEKLCKEEKLTKKQQTRLKTMDKAQSQAANIALTSPLSIITAPPGSGKTFLTSNIAAMYLALKPAGPILVTSTTNNAVDNLLIAAKEAISENQTASRVLAKGLGAKQTACEHLCVKTQADNLVEHLRRVDGRGEITKEEKTKLVRTLTAGANIIGATIQTAAKQLGTVRWGLIIWEEAGLADEFTVYTLMTTFSYKQMLIIGDPKQLAAFTASLAKTSSALDRLRQAIGRTQLNTSYRSHPAITNLVSKVFYDGGLKSALSKEDRQTQPLEILNLGDTPLAFINVEGEAQQKGVSWENLKEAEATVEIVKSIKKSNPANHTLAIITPYAQQASKIKRLVASAFPTEFSPVFTINETQGMEYDTVIISLVKTGSHTEFSTDLGRLNVALSRAKRRVVILGERTAAMKNKTWRAIIEIITQDSPVRNW